LSEVIGGRSSNESITTYEQRISYASYLLALTNRITSCLQMHDVVSAHDAVEVMDAVLIHKLRKNLPVWELSPNINAEDFDNEDELAMRATAVKKERQNIIEWLRVLYQNMERNRMLSQWTESIGGGRGGVED